jgi:DNA polymerase (family 10)
VDRREVSRVLSEIATLLTLRGENVFKVRAYDSAAETLRELPRFEELADRGELASLPGIGKGIVETVTELRKTGRSALHQSLLQEFPAGVFDLMRIPSLGPKKAAALVKEHGIGTLEDLAAALEDGSLAGAAGFGAKTLVKLGEGVRFVQQTSGRWRLPDALREAERARDAFAVSPEAVRAGVTRVEIAGEVRRALEVATCVVLAVAAERPEDLPNEIEAERVPRVSIHAAPPSEFGNTLLRATGSAAHLETLRARNAAALAEPAGSEEEIYARLGLAFVPPELREGRGEVELAAKGELPRLVEPGDIRGPFHVHSTYSDGRAPLAETFRRAVELGFEYVGVTDHSPAAIYARGLTPERLEDQWAEIERLRESFPSLTIFRGTEADILADGSIDYPDDVLARFDFVIASVHSAFHLPEKLQTERLIAAVSNPRVTMLGHVTGRRLLQRSGLTADLSAVLAAAAVSGCLVETNGSPHRLELDWRLGEEARRAGVKTSVNPDAHDLPALEHVRWGVAVARKAGFRKEDVLNTGSAAEVGARLAELRARA